MDQGLKHRTRNCKPPGRKTKSLNYCPLTLKRPFACEQNLWRRLIGFTEGSLGRGNKVYLQGQELTEHPPRAGCAAVNVILRILLS